MEAKKGNIIIGILIVAIIVVAAYYLKDQLSQISSPVRTESLKKDKRAQKTLYIGFIPHIDPKILVKRWQPIEPYLEKELEMPVELVTRSSYLEIIAALVNGDVDVCLLGSIAYISAFQKIKITPLVRRIKYGSSWYHSLIVVREDSGISRLEDLRGKRFAFTDKESTSGYDLPRKEMFKKGIVDPNSYFSEVIYTHNNDSALTAVHNGRVDAAAMTDSVWQDSHEKDKVKSLKHIWKSEAVPLGPFCVREDLDKELTDKIKKAFLKIGKTEDTKKLAEHLIIHGGIEGFEEARDGDYDVIR